MGLETTEGKSLLKQFESLQETGGRKPDAVYQSPTTRADVEQDLPAQDFGQ